ncbi:hypothetical protein BKK51_11610 [Rodentibacter trehalosifermentans]|uniref:Uncharacterized protein n=2 Tax=Rodentibacter trehalosifermentans TaxID=1908263 RepID=A0A1V3IMH7_9PAST|nr:MULTISPECIES: hypothetical protein [Rodentibacter]OOF39587.1 hypothetical protein BKK49_07630 [Rodentibacter rarus]OOF43375.1 hypothetical protein BKK51_11610 [Rodentibacter trehalosifermentans]
MAKSTSKEIERLVNLLKIGAISEKEFQKLRQEAIDGKAGKTKKKDDVSLCDAIKGLIVIGLCVVGYQACKNGDTNDNAPNQAKPVQTLTNKQCEQIFKDEGYYYQVRSTCMALENGDNFYHQNEFVDPGFFFQYARKNNCPLSYEEGLNIKNNTLTVINQKIQESKNKTGDFILFCEEQKSYFSKMLNKYGIK